MRLKVHMIWWEKRMGIMIQSILCGWWCDGRCCCWEWRWMWNRGNNVMFVLVVQPELDGRVQSMMGWHSPPHLGSTYGNLFRIRMIWWNNITWRIWKCKMRHTWWKASPTRGIEPRSPAWQAGILATILCRTLKFL